MKKINNSYIYLFLLLFPLIGNTSFNKAQRVELKRKIFKTEQHLKKIITRDLELSTGVKEILVDVKIDVNQYQIFNEVASVDKTLQKIENMQLPSLFISSDQQKKLREVKEVSVEIVLSHIKKMMITISSPYDVIDEKLMQEKVKAVLASNYDRTSEIKLVIELTKEKQILVDNRVKSLNAPKYMKIVNELKELAPYLLGSAAIILIGFILFVFVFKRSMGKMASALDDIEISANLTASLTPSKTDSMDLIADQRNNQLTKNSDGDISSYIELVDKIRFLVKANKSLVLEMIELHFQIGEINKILILLNILSEEEREDLYKDLKASYLKDLNSYVVNQGENLYKDEGMLNALAQEIFRVISIAMVKPESFYQIYLKKIILSLSADEIANVIRACNGKELMYFLENVNGVKLAYVCATQDLAEINFKQESKELNKEEVKKFVHKLAKFLYIKDAVVDGNAKAKLIPHLNDEMEAKYIESMGISKELSFKNLVAKNIEFVQEYIKNLNFEDISDILALFSNEERKVLFSALPKLVAERLQNKKFELSEKTFILKIDLYNLLKEQYSMNLKKDVKSVNEHLEFIDKEFQQIENNDSDDSDDDVA